MRQYQERDLKCNPTGPLNSTLGRRARGSLVLIESQGTRLSWRQSSRDLTMCLVIAPVHRIQTGGCYLSLNVEGVRQELLTVTLVIGSAT